MKIWRRNRLSKRHMAGFSRCRFTRGLNPPPLAPAGTTTRSNVTSHSCWNTPCGAFTQMGAVSTPSSPALALVKSSYTFTDGRATPVTRWMEQTPPLQISYKMLISFYCSSFGEKGGVNDLSPIFACCYLNIFLRYLLKKKQTQSTLVYSPVLHLFFSFGQGVLWK